MSRTTVIKQCIAAAFSAIMHVCLVAHVHAGWVFNADFPYTDHPYTSNPTTDAGTVLKNSNQWGSLLESLLDIFGINYAWDQKAISYVQVLVNYVLAILWLITLWLILYSFYMVFFGKSEEAIGNARKTIVWSAIALFIIALSAYIVNFLFYIYAKWI